MNVAVAYRQALIDLDITALRRAWAHTDPHLPQPGSDQDVLSTAHYARTQARSVPFKLRAYSHRWLGDHGLPSGLPDQLRPKAERIYPVIVTAVGIAVKPLSARAVPYAKAMELAMVNVVNEMYADGVKDPLLIKPRMLEAANKIK